LLGFSSGLGSFPKIMSIERFSAASMAVFKEIDKTGG